VADSTVTIRNLATGQRLVSLIGGRDRERLSITSAGFFAASGIGADQALSIVRGFDVTTIGQVHQSLFNPDLVREIPDHCVPADHLALKMPPGT
jgi:hypothetical protein